MAQTLIPNTFAPLLRANTYVLGRGETIVAPPSIWRRALEANPPTRKHANQFAKAQRREHARRMGRPVKPSYRQRQASARAAIAKRG